MSGYEVYTALECCRNKKCKACPYNKYSIYGCKGLLIQDAYMRFGELMNELREKKDEE